ncbi:MAG: peptidylprolyl isomerase [Sulfuricella sp.]
MKPNRLSHVYLPLLALLSGALFGIGSFAGDAPPPSAAGSVPPVFAKVGSIIITQQDYDIALVGAARRKFYHGNPSKGAIAVLQREVGETLVTNALLLREARRRALKPDDAAIQKTLQQYEQRYRDNEQYKQNRAQLVQSLTKRLQQESLLSKLESLVRNVPPADEKQMREYYAAHPDKFTEPEQLRLSYILFKVDPSSPPATWEKAREEAQALVKRLRGGADFAALARAKSGDVSAEQGGDLGYLHRGMMSDAVQESVDKLKPGAISDPIRVLEGVGIVRLTERKLPKLNSFEASRKRIRELWLREQSDLAWKSLIARLRKETPVHVDESRYLPLTATAGEHAVKK